ncbi:fungal-specific transcription factor domain-containing protein [Thelonectria olida]|uniref:Fungal-specific transcription factor domain-containing protein n=1 Tax=Thelonectria olida TaxID=1576542 RepID=A0A9P8VLY9_9HYPO|nr:fungal-specific transcription factor domain-containing protein [Thelonectria olida]
MNPHTPSGTILAPDTTDSPTGPAQLNENENGSQRPKKRQKVRAACDRCRDKKIKCDGLRPVCNSCQRRQIPPSGCTWGARRGRGSSASREELSQLARRLRELESERPSLDKTAGDGTPLQISAERGHEAAHQNNAMLGLIEEKRNFPNRGHGNSSVSSFMSQIKHIIDQHSSASNSSPGVRRIAENDQFGHLNAAAKQHVHIDYVLPPRQRADRLLEVYWRFVDPLYPFLDKTQLDLMYQRLWTGESLGRDGKMFICLLNVIFSLACNLNPLMRPEERSKNATVFYQRGKVLLDFSDIQHRSILTVQCFLLSGQYLQSTNEPQQCWMFVGLAIRTAQSLGLDLPATSAEAHTINDGETMRKVWHGCILMDRTLSMTFGRPQMISPEAVASVPRPLAHKEDEICACYLEPHGPDAVGNDLHFFIEALKLYELMSEALLALYNISNDSRPENDDVYARYFGSHAGKVVGRIFDLDNKLQRWKRDLPLHLQYDLGTSKSSIHKRQSHVLWLRFLHTRILLLRPVLSRFCSGHDHMQGSFHESLPWKIAPQLSAKCVQTALATIDFFDSSIGDKAIEKSEDLLPAWWYSTFYIYSAATVLAAAQLHPTITAEVGAERIMDGCRAVMKLLMLFQRFGSHATRCATAISVLFDQVLVQQENSRKHRKQPQRPEKSDGESAKAQNEGADQQDPIHTGSQDAAQAEPSPIHTYWPSTGVDFVQSLDVAEGSYGRPWDLNQMCHPREIKNLAPADSLFECDFENFKIHLDLDDMSWLNSIPSELYES